MRRAGMTSQIVRTLHLGVDRVFIGVDPGNSGAIAALRLDGTVLDTYKFGRCPHDVDFGALVFLRVWVDVDPAAYLEHVWASPQMGVSSAFTFGKGYGAIRMALAAAGIPVTLVTPQTWQKALGCRTAGDKNISKARAQELFMTVKVTHAIADALLIAEYGRRSALGLWHLPAQPRGHNGEDQEDRSKEGQGQAEVERTLPRRPRRHAARRTAKGPA